MLHDENLNKLFLLLKEMTLQAKKADSPFSPSRTVQRIESGLLIGFAATMLVLVAVVARYQLPSQPPPHGLPGSVAAIYLFGMLLATLYVAAVTVNGVRIVWRYRHERFPAILGALESDLKVDAAFLAQLWAFDKPTLEYSLVQYRNQWERLDKRLASLTGDIRRIGLFPALTAAAMTAAPLMKDGSSLPFWGPLIIACCFYVLAFIAVNQRARPEQVITLLEYAVTYAGEPMEAPHPAGPSETTKASAAEPTVAVPLVA